MSSEVSRIRQQIADEYQSAQYIFSGFTPTAKHELITQRQERIADHFEELKKHMSPEDAMKVLIQLTEGEKDGKNNRDCPPV